MSGYLRDGRVEPNGSRYATGDLVFVRTDGQIMFRGRQDTQRRIRSLRIDLPEIERVLDEHPMIRECAAAVLDQKLYVLVCVEAADLTALAIRQYAATTLPSYMVPTIVYFVAGLPRHANSKSHRKEIDRMIKSRCEPSLTFRPPINRQVSHMEDIERLKEEISAFLIEEALQVDSRGFTHDTDLIEIVAIDSMSMVELVTFLESTYKIEIGIEELDPSNLETVRAIAAMVRRLSVG